MIPLTEMKLREAKFFFALLHKSRSHTVNGDPAVFAFYLSAFLSAARAVTFALKFEEKSNYNTWFPPWLESRNKNERKLLEFMVKQRNFVQKRGSPAFTAAGWEWLPIIQVKIDAERSHTAYGFQFWAPWRQGAQAGRQVYHFEEFSGDQKEVTSVCKQYLDILDELVKDFVQQFTA